MRTLRVLHLSDNLELGGVQRVLVDFVRAVRDRGHVVGVAAGDAGDLWSELPPEVVRIPMPDRRGRLWTSFRHFLRMRRILRSGDWDLVHSHQRGVSLIARLAAVGTATKVIEHVHNTFRPNPLTRFVSFRAHHLVACGSAIGEMLVMEFGRSRARVEVIANTVPDHGHGHDLVLPSARGAIPRIVGVGRLVSQKDPERFVEVISILNRDELRVTAEWIGDGPLFDTVASKIDEDCVRGIELSGWSRDVPAKIRCADVLLLSSRHAGLPMVALEALSVGRGVIAPDVGSCYEVVIPGINGALFDRDAPASEIARIVRIAMDGGEFGRWGEESRSIYLRSGGAEDAANLLLGLYERVATKAPVSPEGVR